MLSFIALFAKKGGGGNLNLWNYYNCTLRKSNSENYFYTHVKLIYSLKGPDQWASKVAHRNADHSPFNFPLITIFLFSSGLCNNSDENVNIISQTLLIKHS